jgi:hypothetical protein
MIDVSTLERAEMNEIRAMGVTVKHVWHGEAHGVKVSLTTEDLWAEYWVSPIWTMREKGVALVDKNGNMVKNERRDR